MTAPANVSRVGYQTVSSGVRITLDDQVLGPVMTKRAARVVARWLEGGALAELEGEGKPKIQRVLSDIDRAIDSFGDLMKNGLR
jgi:hypothetical protein